MPISIPDNLVYIVIVICVAVVGMMAIVYNDKSDYKPTKRKSKKTPSKILAKVQQAKKLQAEGKTVREIMVIMGYKSTSPVHNLLHKK